MLFALGAGTRLVESRADQMPQRVAQGLRFGLLIALAAVGLSLIFGTTGLTNFAHGELVTLGALVAYYFNVDGRTCRCHRGGARPSWSAGSAAGCSTTWVCGARCAGAAPG